MARGCGIVAGSVRTEMRALATQAGLSVVETFRAGGREGNLSLYAIMTATD